MFAWEPESRPIVTGMMLAVDLGREWPEKESEMGRNRSG